MSLERVGRAENGGGADVSRSKTRARDSTWLQSGKRAGRGRSTIETGCKAECALVSVHERPPVVVI